MHKTTRRTALMGMVTSIPIVWTAPIVDTVLLPAHGLTTGCVGCIPTMGEGEGGSGIVNVLEGGQTARLDFWEGTLDCGPGDPTQSFDLVIANDQDEASEIWSSEFFLCSSGEMEPATFVTGCNLWFCDLDS